MLLGLYFGHLVFMCCCWKTTNESLKRGERYLYFMRQFQRTSAFGPLNAAFVLCCRKRHESMITNQMVVNLYEEKIRYLKETATFNNDFEIN